MRSRLVSTLLLSGVVVLLASACGPRGGDGVAPEVRRQYEVTIFTDDPETGRRVLAAIEAMGYTHPENEVLDTPNDEYNIKWGGAPEEVVEELQGIVEPMIHQELFPRHIFGPEDHDIFINLPVCKFGGAYRPETCGMATTTVDPQYNEQGIPQACGFARESADFGSISVGSRVVLGKHRPVDGDANWVDEMEAYVGQTATVTELFGTDGSGCPVVHVDSDNGDWFWRVRDMRLSGGGPTPIITSGGAIPTSCGMTDETVQYGPLRVGSKIKLGRHTPWQGDENWAESMSQYVGQEASVTELAGTDAAGCPLVKVDVDGGAWFWRIRDAVVVGAVASSGFPQHCGQTDEAADYGAAQIGAQVRVGRHREVNGDANWNDAMESFVGQSGTVTEHLGVDSQGCPVVHVSVDSGNWAWRVRDLMKP